MNIISPTIPVNEEGRSVKRRGGGLWQYSLYAFFGILFLAICWGLFVRFDGLGSRPLVDDEYFSVTSVQYILDKAIPQFPTGGYYVRGLPLQYLQAASVGLFGDNEFSHRLPAALFGVLTLVLTFYYARIFLPWLLAATCVAMLAVSGWEVEFGRFSRMYAAFQCATVAFFLAYHRAYFGGSEKMRYLPHALALVAILFHELGVFLLPFLFLPLLIEQNAVRGATPPRNRSLFAIVSLVTMLVGVAYWQLDSRLRNFNVAQRLPDSFRLPPSESLGPLGAFTILPISANILGVFLAIVALVGCFLFLSTRRRTASSNPFSALDAGLLLLLLSTVLHLFALSACIGIVLLVRYQLHRNVLRDRGRLLLLALSGLTACAWIVYAIYDQSWREQIVAADLRKSLRVIFFGWPDFYQPVIQPWIASLPILTAVFLVALAWHIVRQGGQSLTSVLRHPIVIILGTFCSIAVIDPIVQPVLKTTRYFYHVYPFMILLIVMACYEAFRRTTGNLVSPKRQILISGFVSVGLFVGGEDFNLQQLLHVNSQEVTYRTGRFKRYEHHWYWRRDNRSPAKFLNEHRNEVDALVVSFHARPMFYYLESQVDFALYCSREGVDAPRNSRAGEDAAWYGEIARSKGKVDLWTGRRLLGTEQELRAYTSRVDSLFLVRLVVPSLQEFEVDHVWPKRLQSCHRVFLSSDGSTEVVKILLNQPLEKVG
jgi:4-amino-4-deoxy-L-arabinose transferase-like glycosyltransferase